MLLIQPILIVSSTFSAIPIANLLLMVCLLVYYICNMFQSEYLKIAIHTMPKGINVPEILATADPLVALLGIVALCYVAGYIVICIGKRLMLLV